MSLPTRRRSTNYEPTHQVPLYFNQVTLTLTLLQPHPNQVTPTLTLAMLVIFSYEGVCQVMLYLV